MVFSSEPVAGVGVADRQHEEAESESQQHHVQHLVLLPSEAAQRGSQPSPLGWRLLASQGIGFRDGSGSNVIGISYRRGRATLDIPSGFLAHPFGPHPEEAAKRLHIQQNWILSSHAYR